MKEEIAAKYDKGRQKGGESDKDKLNEDYVKRYVLACRDEAARAKENRMELNRENYNVYHLEHDFSHKQPGQSTENIPKVKMAVETTKSFFQQGLADITEWWRVVRTDGISDDNAVIKKDEIFTLTNFMLKQSDYYTHVGNSVFSALLGALAINRVTGKLKSKPKYTVKTEGKGTSYRKSLVATEDKTWTLCFEETRQGNYYPDPTARKLYEITEEFMDKFQVLDLACGEYGIYDKEKVEDLQGYGGSLEEDWSTESGGPTKAEETGQNPVYTGLRPTIKLTRFLGNIIDETTGKLLYENVMVTIANDDVVIQKPTPNPFWHQGSDIVAAPLLEVPHSVWHTALMDSPSKLNMVLTEILNMMLDAAMSSIHGIKQIRPDWCEDISQVSNGIKYGTAIKVNSSAPPGAKVIEDAIVGQFPPEVFSVQNMVQQEYNASALTSDLRGGITPNTKQSATATVEQSNTITSVFKGITKNVEVKLIQPELTLAWKTICQNWDLIDQTVFTSLFGPERGEELYQLEPEEVFAATVSGVQFEVYGLSMTMNQQLDFQKYLTLFQTIGASPAFMEAFLADFDMKKLLSEIVTTLGVDKKKIQVDKEAAAAQAAQQAPQAPPGANGMSQVPQPGAGLSLLGGTQQLQGGPQPAEGSVG